MCPRVFPRDVSVRHFVVLFTLSTVHLWSRTDRDRAQLFTAVLVQQRLLRQVIERAMPLGLWKTFCCLARARAVSRRRRPHGSVLAAPFVSLFFLPETTRVGEGRCYFETRRGGGFCFALIAVDAPCARA